MTLLDLIKLILHHIKLTIALPIICVVVAVATVLVAPASYSAQAMLITSGDIALAGGLASNQATDNSQNGIEVSSSIDTSLKTIIIKAKGNDASSCIEAANSTAHAAAEDYKSINNNVSINTVEASSATNTSPSVAKVTLVALLVGLFAAVCVVILIDAIKTPIKSRNDIEEASGLPVIGTIPNPDKGECLLANIRFLTEQQPSNIAVVPVGSASAMLTCAELATAYKRSGLQVSRVPGNPHAEGFRAVKVPGVVKIVECAPLSEGMGAVYIAKEADLTILCVSEWKDSREALAFTVEELNFAKANIGGVIFITEGKQGLSLKSVQPLK